MENIPYTNWRKTWLLWQHR